jgi:trypsin
MLLFNAYLIGLTLKFIGASPNPEDTKQVNVQIVKGVKSGGFPWVASLQNKNGDHFCGGALISKTAILTAAHCLEDMNATAISVQIGAQTLDGASKEDRIQGKSINLAPNFSNVKKGDSVISVKDDIAILVLEKESQNQVLQVDLDNMPKNIGSKAIASGYGYVSGETSNPSPKPLNQVELEITNDEFCKTQSTIFDSNQNLCLKGPSNNLQAQTCYGDSGSSLLYQGKSIGVVSAGLGGCVGGSSFYTKTYPYADFIKQYL